MSSTVLKSVLKPLAIAGSLILALNTSSAFAVNVGDSAPNFKLPRLERSGDIQLSSFRGKVVYVDFWASWCVPCRKSFPWMNAMQAKHQQDGLVVLSINLDAQAELAEKFLQQTPANFAIIYDAKGKLAKKFKLKGMPSSYLFNRQGKLISAHSGFNGKKQQIYQQEIEKALAQ